MNDDSAPPQSEAVQMPLPNDIAQVAVLMRGMTPDNRSMILEWAMIVAKRFPADHQANVAPVISLANFREAHRD
ncbi:MAG: hypothetical protein JNK06_07300 [Candidatus Accumulibacter phosphatis]|uniref:hypothetical protein n=1 Tax=Candidatus Accumulibacter phosphatis TaxID=327160 RepID=UPI001A612922|nr:hypothetical protein [Candidatus Accumulibacter phosphatis]